MKDFLNEQHKLCVGALDAIKTYGDSRGLKEWFEGRRDMCVIALQELERQLNV
jgi:hypothetical protein